MSSQSDGPARGPIEATAYKPYVAEESRLSIRPWQVVLTLVALAAVIALVYLFTAKSVTFRFSSPPTDVTIEGGLSFQLGGVYLLREGDYTIHASSEGYQPLVTNITVTDARQQEVQLNFTPLPGWVTFVVDPADAAITVDGIKIDPAEAISIAAGQHEVRLDHPRYQGQTLIYDVTGREQQQTLEVNLTPNWGDITVATQPPGARITIDGEATELTTPAVVPILAGEREIAAHLEGFRSARMRLVVAAQESQTIPTFQLVQADAELVVTSQPAGAGITVNGEYVGQSPVTLTLKSAPNYRVEAILEGYRRAAKQIDLKRGTNAPVSLKLVREMGEVSVAAQPAEAVLKINGKTLGPANRLLRLPITPHKLEIALPGYASYITTLTPRAGITQSVKVRLLTEEEARRQALKPSYETSQGQQLVLIEPGQITLGASRREPGRRANETLRDVTLTKLFYMSRHEVTNEQFRAFATGHDSADFEENDLNKNSQPVVGVSWHDAALYCNWLSRKEGLPPFYVEEFGKVVGTTGEPTGYRLPTEAEWAWSARAHGNSDGLLRYPWGQNLPPPDRHGNYADRAAQHLVGRIIFNYNDNYVVTAPVGSYEPNSLGLYDIGGNVAEWTHDFYQIPSKDPTTDPTGPSKGEYHVIKGSSWMHGTITDLRLSFRDYGIDGRKDLGFRIARYAE